MSEVVLIVLSDDDDDDDDGTGSDGAEDSIVLLGESEVIFEEDEEDEDLVEDAYQAVAASEFVEDLSKGAPRQSTSAVKESSALATPTTAVDWGGALGKLRQRVEDIESGKSMDPSHSLYRLMSSQTPSQQIASFVSTASPTVVTAMSSAISSLLGGLASTPVSGFDTVVKASSEKLGSLCFQLQMTGYMFRNAEYVMALKQLMNIKGSATLEDYKEAFDEIDSDGSGFIDTDEIRDLFDRVYKGKVPKFEVDAFLKFFDANRDGRISWEEFEQGLGRAMAEQNQANRNLRLLGFGSVDDDDDDVPDVEPRIEGTVEVELEDGNMIEIEANEYVKSLKQEVRALKASLRREKGLPDMMPSPLPGMKLEMPGETFGGITDYIARRQGDLKSLTESISPEIVSTMKMLVEFVLDGGDSGKARKDKRKEDLELEVPGAALQQLALWQLVLGYRLREAEAKGDYLKLLE
jgi:Protein of unknown function (DUF760)/EF-hand domain pair